MHHPTPRRRRGVLLAGLALLAACAVLAPTAASAAAAPRTLTITAGPAGTVRTRTATFRFTRRPATVAAQCKLDTGAWQACSSPKRYTGVTDGAHTFRVRIKKNTTRNSPYLTRTRSWTVDGTAPSAPTLSYAVGASNTIPVDVEFEAGTDASAPVTTTLSRQVAPVTSGECGTFGAFAVLTGAVSPYSDEDLDSGQCVVYKVTTTDPAGNATSTTGGELLLDADAPVGGIDDTPASPFAGTVTLHGTATDALTDVDGVIVTFDNLVDPVGTACATTPASGTWGCNWDTTQVDNGTYTLSAVISDSAGNDVVDEREVVVDNGATPQGPAILIEESDGGTTVSEAGATDTYDVTLATQPTDDVIVTVTSDAEVDADAATLTFTSADWDTPQTVEVSAVDDDIAEGTHGGSIQHVAASDDEDYDGLAGPDVSAAITDDDTAGLAIVGGGSIAVTEGGATDSFTVALTSEPRDDVTVTVAGDAQVTATATLTFTPDDWDTPQNVTVTAVNDGTAEGAHTGTISFIISGPDATYTVLSPANLTAQITDND